MHAMMNNEQFTALFTCENKRKGIPKARHSCESRNLPDTCHSCESRNFSHALAHHLNSPKTPDQSPAPAKAGVEDDNLCQAEHSRSLDTDSHCRPLLTLLESMSDKAGARFLIELINHPNQPIHVSQLRHLHNLPLMDRPEYRPYEGANSHKSSFLRKHESSLLSSHSRAGGNLNPFKESSIPYCDKKTLDDVKKRLKRLQIIKHEAKCCNDYARLDDIYTEEEFLIDYLKKAFNRKGEPRYLRDTLRDDYSYVKKSIDRIIDRIRECDPNLSIYIENHLKTGLRFTWKEFNS